MPSTYFFDNLVTYVSNKDERVSSESAYLTPEVLSRPNITVVIQATVTRLLFETATGKLRVVGVKFANAESGPCFQTGARKKVVIWYDFCPYVSPHLIKFCQCWRCSIPCGRATLSPMA
jgi:hypothetical protein